MPYLFVHFKEKITPDGEQVYFGISRDGINWEQVNGGNPILTSTMSQKGCRDIEIVRLHTGGFVILTTDLCIAYHFDENYNVAYVGENGSVIEDGYSVHGGIAIRPAMWIDLSKL